MTTSESIDILKQMATDLNISPYSKEGRAISKILDVLWDRAEDEILRDTREWSKDDC